MSSSLLDTFTDLVRIDSPTGREQNMEAYLLQRFAQMGVSAELDAIGNVFATIPGYGEPLFMAAHMDTVEPGQGIVPTTKGGAVTSKGDTILGADNKATIAVILEVLGRLKAKDHRPLELLFTVGEESDNTGAAEFDYGKLKAKQGIIADIALPVGTIVLASPAYKLWDVELIGKGSHAAFPDRARSVLPALGNILLELPSGRLDDQTIFNIGTGTLGTVRNAVPGTAVLHGEMRGFDRPLLKKHARRIFKQMEMLAKKHGIRIKISSPTEQPLYRFEATDHWIQTIASIMEELHIVPSYAESWSFSDANFFNMHNIRVVNLGDGTKNTHTLQESIALEDMKKLADIFYACCTKEVS